MAHSSPMAALHYGRAVVTNISGSKHQVPSAAKSSVDHQHLRVELAEYADCCDLMVGSPTELGVHHGSCAARGAARSAATFMSTCSTADTDRQSEAGSSSTDGDASLAGQVWPLSRDPEGCRRVQAALEAAPSDAAREALAAELHGHVAKAMRCSHANHVLQKCIALMRPESLQFIVDELLARSGLVVQAARHRYACRIVQHTLRKCPAAQTAELAEALLQDAKTLARHTIGHYTVQQMLELGTEDQRYRLIRTIERNARSISLSTSGGAVVRAALAYAPSEDKVWIARAMLQDPMVLPSLATSRHGSAAVVQVLQALESQEREQACALLLEHGDVLDASNFGHVVLERLLCGSRTA